MTDDIIEAAIYRPEFTIATAQQLITSGENGYTYYRPVFQKLAKYYLAIMDDKLRESLEKRDKSRIFFPMINTKVKRVLASFQEAYFSNDEFAKVSPTDEEPQNTIIAEALQKAADFYTSKEMKLFSNFDEIFLEAIVYGTAIAKVMWDGTKPRIDKLSIDDVYFDPSARSFEDCRFVIEKIYLTQSDIAKLQRDGIYDNTFDAYSLNQDSLSNAAGLVANNKYSKVVLHDVYFKENGKWYLATVHNKTTIVRSPVELTDGLPIFAGYLVPQFIAPLDYTAIRSYGDSPIASLIPLQDEMNARRNQQIDALGLQLNPKMIVQLGSGIDPLDLKRGAGSIIKANNINGVQVLPPPNIASSINEVSRLDAELQEAIGVTSYNSGVDSSQLNNTATGISILSQEANTRIQAYIRSFNETFMEPVFMQLCRLIYKYGDARFFDGIDRSAPLKASISINTGIGATNKQVQLNAYQTAYQMFMAMQDVPNARRILKEILPILGIKNTKEYFENDNQGQSGNPINAAIAGVPNPNGLPDQPQGEPVQSGDGYGQQPQVQIPDGANQGA